MKEFRENIPKSGVNQGDKKDDYSAQDKIRNRNSWLLVFVVVVITLVISSVIFFRLIIENDALNIDIATILTTLLAFFSIYLSATFYFKTTEQSNNFYDRSYSHTKDIAESLSNMRGEFGKSLDLIEKNSDAMNQRFDNMPWEQISEKRKEIEDVEKQRDDSLKRILEEAGVEQSKQSEYMRKLNEQEKHISHLNNEINKLRPPKNIQEKYIMSCLLDFIYEVGANKIIEADANYLIEMFHKTKRDLSLDDLKILIENNIIDSSENLTNKGILFIKDIAINYTK